MNIMNYPVSVWKLHRKLVHRVIKQKDGIERATTHLRDYKQAVHNVQEGKKAATAAAASSATAGAATATEIVCLLSSSSDDEGTGDDDESELSTSEV